MLAVGHSISDDVLKKQLEDATNLLIDEARDTLHTTTSSKTTDGGLRNALDVVTKHFPMALGATFPQAFATLAAS
jgi:hypothetical protein